KIPPLAGFLIPRIRRLDIRLSSICYTDQRTEKMSWRHVRRFQATGRSRRSSPLGQARESGLPRRPVIVQNGRQLSGPLHFSEKWTHLPILESVRNVSDFSTFTRQRPAPSPAQASSRRTRDGTSHVSQET